MFKTRLISGIVLVALALLFIINGGLLLWGVMAIISLIGLFELYRAIGIEKSGLAIAGYIFSVVYYCNLLFKGTLSLPVLLAFMITLMMVYVFAYPKFDFKQVAGAFFGLVYVSVMLSCLYLTRNYLANGEYLVWLIFLCSWGCDTCAYCVGMLIGKHKMSPILSPKKSIEGAVGGVVGAALLTALYSYIFMNQMSITSAEIVILAIMSAVGALISMVGDLTASAIKRNYDIKDYGKLIPGHGGILDRFDSIIITAPIIYYLCLYFM